MKAILFLILIAFIICQPNSFMHASKEERLERQKIVKAKLIQCINENASEEFKEFVQKNIDNFRKAFAENRENISKEDKRVVRECRLKIIKERNEERNKKENGL